VALPFGIRYWDRGNSRSLHFASVGMTLLFAVWQGKFRRSEGHTADPLASLGMTKGRVALPFDIGYWDRRNSRSLHFATPDFLLDLVALSQFMRPSLRKGAHADLSSAAWQKIRVRFGRDDTSV
jgi:hypothetical protein